MKRIILCMLLVFAMCLIVSCGTINKAVTLNKANQELNQLTQETLKQTVKILQRDEKIILDSAKQGNMDEKRINTLYLFCDLKNTTEYVKGKNCKKLAFELSEVGYHLLECKKEYNEDEYISGENAIQKVYQLYEKIK